MKAWFSLMIICNLFVFCSPNNVVVDDTLQKHFTDNGVTGTFGIYDNGKGDFTIYNLKRFKDSTYLPASTFKIVNSLVGIETGRIVDENMIIPWDGIKRNMGADSISSWNRDMTMAEAFEYSNVPYFQEVARRIGKDTMQQYIDTLGYASRYSEAVIQKIDSFWLNNNLKVTPDEQLGLVKKLYFDQLPFQKRTQRVVRQVMLRENNANYKLSYKTGWGFSENGNGIGWVVGWIVENNHFYPFVLNVEGPASTDMVTVRTNVLVGILKQLGFLEGKK